MTLKKLNDFLDDMMDIVFKIFFVIVIPLLTIALAFLCYLFVTGMAS